jgi:hypothetical protein
MGWFANSFRSAGISQLILLIFLETFATYYQLQDMYIPQYPQTEPWIRIATNNQGLVKCIRSGLATMTVFAGAGLNADYNIVNEIVNITHCLPPPLIWEHAKGHQDERQKWYELTNMEKLNIRADGHTATGLTNNLNPAKLIPMIPLSQIALYSVGTDITSHYATHLHKAATQPTMLQRCLKHYRWSTAQVDMIDWKVHHGTLQKLQFADKNFVTKFIHQSLPMGTIFHRIDPSQPINCSSCKVTPESATHLY